MTSLFLWFAPAAREGAHWGCNDLQLLRWLLQHTRLLRKLHRDPRRLGDFISSFLRGGSGARCILDRAIAADGRTTYDPEVYEPIIRDVVSAPLSTGVGLPQEFDGVQARPRLTPSIHGLFASTDARARGCRPSWFDDFYAPKQEHRRRFSEIMAPPTAAEVLRVIQRASAGKSPGHDLLDVDFWKLVTAAGPGQSQCLEVVVRLIGASMELGEVPEDLKLGWITMVPKVKPDESFKCKASAMRPITVLPLPPVPTCSRATRDQRQRPLPPVASLPIFLRA